MVITKTDSRLQTASRTLATAAANGKWQLALAESCTGGLAAAGLTEIPGASKWFSLGIVCYTNAAKIKMLGISPEVLQKHGAVSEATAAQMCNGALKLLSAKPENGENDGNDGNDESVNKMAIAITGIAGPGGDNNIEKPIGTICFGWQKEQDGKQQTAITETITLTGTRQTIRHQAAAYALAKAAAIIAGVD